MSDLFQFIDDIDADMRAMVAKRLEDRAQMPKFAAIRENYFDKIGPPITGRIHELGCGTGAVCRVIASRPGFVGSVVDPILKTGRPACHPISPGHSIGARLRLARSALPRSGFVPGHISTILILSTIVRFSPHSDH
jgi:hypothetical protein